MPSRDIKTLEEKWKESYDALQERRDNDKRTASAKQIKQVKKTPGVLLGAYLTPDILDRRNELTLQGHQKLVFDFGERGTSKHEPVPFTLKELNDMAAAIKQREKRYSAGSNGVPISQLLDKADKDDKHRAKDIAAATLYKFQGNILTFRVTASGESEGAPSHYQVKIRLDGWKSAANMEGQQYINKVKYAVHGNVSIDCNCGRYLYWYRYLATIGDFAISPENVFPKIRNPKLSGCACKHILRTLTSLSSPVVQQRIAREMQNQAQSHKATSDEEKYLKAEQLKRMNKAGSADAANAFKEFNKASKAFKKKAAEDVAKEALRMLKPKKGKKPMLDDATKVKAAETVISKMRDDQRKMIAARLRDLSAFSKSLGLPFESMVAKSVENNPGAGTKDELMAVAKEEGLL